MSFSLVIRLLITFIQFNVIYCFWNGALHATTGIDMTITIKITTEITYLKILATDSSVQDCWYGIGFGSLVMNGANSMILENRTMTEYVLPHWSKPSTSINSEWDMDWYYVEDGLTEIVLMRDNNVGGGDYYTFSESDESIDVIIAHGKPGEDGLLAYHGTSRVSMTLYPTSTSTTTTTDAPTDGPTDIPSDQPTSSPITTSTTATLATSASKATIPAASTSSASTSSASSTERFIEPLETTRLTSFVTEPRTTQEPTTVGELASPAPTWVTSTTQFETTPQDIMRSTSLYSFETLVANSYLDEEQTISVMIGVDYEEEQMLIVLNGPGDVWFGVGFGSDIMTSTYSINVEGEDGVLAERILGHHSAGELLHASDNDPYIFNDDDGSRWLYMIRDWYINDESFNFGPFALCEITELNVIYAVGSGHSFGYHARRGNRNKNDHELRINAILEHCDSLKDKYFHTTKEHAHSTKRGVETTKEEEDNCNSFVYGVSVLCSLVMVCFI